MTTLQERIRQAQARVGAWPAGKTCAMQLQGSQRRWATTDTRCPDCGHFIDSEYHWWCKPKMPTPWQRHQRAQQLIRDVGRCAVGSSSTGGGERG